MVHITRILRAEEQAMARIAHQKGNEKEGDKKLTQTLWKDRIAKASCAGEGINYVLECATGREKGNKR